MAPLISICAGSHRPSMWMEFYTRLIKYKKNIDFEIIFAGPNEPDYKLPADIRFIKTADIKPAQCCEIAIRESQGDCVTFLQDDIIIWQAGLDDIYQEQERICNEEGTHKIICFLPLKSAGSWCPLTYPKCRFYNKPYASVNAAIINKQLIKELKEPGWIDQRFVGVYWDCDLAMRFNEIGVKLIKIKKPVSAEYLPEGKHTKTRLHGITKLVDGDLLNKLWVRNRHEQEKDEDFPTKDAYGPMKFKYPAVLSKNRLKRFVEYEDKDILVKSQGPKKAVEKEWD